MATGPEGTLPAGVRPLIPGDPPVVGHYPLLGRLGVGGMGVVYLGHHPDHGLVAVKIIRASHRDYPDHPDFAELRGRFRTEVEFARRVSTCCTARVIEDGTEASHPYIVTEYVQGPPLHEVVERSGALPPETVDAVALGVTAALVAIHRAGLAHRDLKPANLLLARTGPRVIDFGLASDIDIAGGPTKAGVVMGSPGWIAPERLAGDAATPASDIFSWGCLVAYAATGRHPFGDGGAAELTDRVMHGQPDLDGIGEALRGPVAAALAKEPGMRPTADGLLRTLISPYLDGRSLAPGENVEGIAASVIAKIWQPPADLPAEPAATASAAEAGTGGGGSRAGDSRAAGGGGVGDESTETMRRPKGAGGRNAGMTVGAALSWTAAAAALTLSVVYGLHAADRGGDRLSPQPGEGLVVSPHPTGRASAGPSGGHGRVPGAQASAAPSGTRGAAGHGQSVPGTGSAAPVQPAPTATASTEPNGRGGPPIIPPGQIKKSEKARAKKTKSAA